MSIKWKKMKIETQGWRKLRQKLDNYRIPINRKNSC